MNKRSESQAQSWELPPGDWMTQKQAARTLGVEVNYLVGLADNSKGKLRHCERPGKTGAPVRLFLADDVRALAELLG